ncbi:MAG: hypothetical protein AAF208_02290 [Cyanobacteria bacterium P01_A01_bin.45]
MALVPCKVCGTLNSDEAEICLSCEYPVKGRKRPIIFQWAAIAVIIALSVPLLISLVNLIKPKPEQPLQNPGKVTKSLVE